MTQEINFDSISVLPKYEQIVKALKSDIVSGKYANGTQLPPEPELASLFNISRPTLRKSLKILEEQNLIQQRKGRGTFITYGASKKFRIGINFSVEEVNQQTFGLQVLNCLISKVQCSQGNELVFLNTNDSSKSSILQAYNDLGCDGLIVLGTSYHDINEVCSPAFDNIPIIILFADMPSVTTGKRVWVNPAPRGVIDSINYLYELGHRKIIYLTAENDNRNLQQRNTEFKHVIDELGITDTSTYLTIKNCSSWYDGARELIRQQCALQDRPTAVLCPGHMFAYGAWQGIMDCGFKIPEDMAIIGYGCHESFNPYLTSINLNISEMSEIAGDMLQKLLEHRTLQQTHFQVPSKLEIRGSCSRVQNKRY